MIQIVSPKVKVSPQELKERGMGRDVAVVSVASSLFSAHAAAVGGQIGPSTTCALCDQQAASDRWLLTVISAVRVTDFNA
jgi:hypothetical protein